MNNQVDDSVINLARRSPAFFRWFKQTYQSDVREGAKYLADCATKGEKDSIVWDLLKLTGDQIYTPQTFVKAAGMIFLTTVPPSIR